MVEVREGTRANISGFELRSAGKGGSPGTGSVVWTHLPPYNEIESRPSFSTVRTVSRKRVLVGEVAGPVAGGMLLRVSVAVHV
jgi:hypothetical protein